MAGRSRKKIIIDNKGEQAALPSFDERKVVKDEFIINYLISLFKFFYTK